MSGQPDLLMLLEKACLRAGRKVMRSYRQEAFKVDQKRRADPRTVVSEADLESEREVFTVFRPALHCGFVSEEAGSLRGESGYRVIVDSLDGSKNFVERNFGLFAVSVAVELAPRIEAGAVYLPYFGDLVAAQRGRGVFRNGRPVQAPASGRAARQLKYARLCIARGGAEPAAMSRRPLSDLLGGCADTLNYGSCAMGMTAVALGCVDAFVMPAQKYWDLAAGWRILRELGVPVGIWKNGWRERLSERQLTQATDKDLLDVAAAGTSPLFRQISRILKTGDSPRVS